MKTICMIKETSLNLTLFALILSVNTHGQTSFTLPENFPSITLPTCINYSHDEKVFIGAVFHTDSVGGELIDIIETNENYKKDGSLIISADFVKQHLLPESKFIYRIDVKTKDTLFATSIEDYLNSTFYAIGRVITNTDYYVVLYERLFSTSGISSSEKFICTITKQGKFLARTLIASLVYSGTSISISGARVPYFPEVQSCLEKDMTIKFRSENVKEIKYKIKSNGEIVELK